MAKYTVENPTTKKRITFEWTDPNPPTDADIDEIFKASENIPKKSSFMATTGGLVSDIVKEATKPVITMAARPAQLGLTAYSAATGKNIDPTLKVPFYGEIKPPEAGVKGAAKELGTGLKAVALGLSPAAMGAAYGGGSALEKGKKLPSVALEAVLGGLIGKAGDVGTTLIAKGAKKFGELGIAGLARLAQKSGIPLTRVQKLNKQKQFNVAADYLTKNKMVGDNEERYQILKATEHKMEETLQDFLERNNTAKAISVDKSKVIGDLEKLKTEMMRDNADAAVVGKQVDNAIKNIQAQYRTNNIPAARFNQLKRSTFDGAYNKAGDKVLSDVEYEIGSVYKKNLENALDPDLHFKADSPLRSQYLINGKKLSAFNKEYSDIITTQKILNLVRGKPSTSAGLGSKLITAGVGGAVGGAVGYREGGRTGAALGAAAGFAGAPFAKSAVEYFLGTPAKSRIAAGLESTARMTSKLRIPK